MNDLRERFIADLKLTYGDNPLPDLSLVQSGQPNSGGRVGSFKDKKVQTLWQGYRMAHGVNHREVKVDQKGTHAGTYVVGKVDNKKVRFSPSPYRHQRRELANAECQRLVALYGESFAIWRCVEIYSPPAQPDTADENLN